MSLLPEQKARENIDSLLKEANWTIQSMNNLDITASF